MHTNDAQSNLEDLVLLSDDVRRRLYEFVAARGDSVTREEVATAVGISRSLAAYHLDKLAAGDLLDVTFARPDGRTGPGSGRPAKRYSRSRRELAITVPSRNYSLLAKLLATAADAAPSDEFRAALAAASMQEGTTLGEHTGDLTTALTTAGFEPKNAPGEDIILRNCPFDSIAQEHSDLACNLNHAFVRGALQGVHADPDRAELSPGCDRCCVVIHPEHQS